jgi:prepilin-type N-terminal cleavage/methylation domain-containing protein
MLNKIKNRKQEGFTIIEVLIVLAIAGLIMLIVFLAVPALQRNSRNTQRQADASKIAAALGQCMSNKNGQVPSCDTYGELVTSGGLEANKLQQIVAPANVTVTATAPATPAVGAAEFNTANAGFVAKCNAAGDGLEPTGVSTRQAAVLFRQENGQAGGIVRCIDV